MNTILLVIILAISTGLFVTGLGNLPGEFAERNLTQGEGRSLLQAVKHIQDNQGHLGLVTGALVAITGLITIVAARAITITADIGLIVLIVLNSQLARHRATITRAALTIAARTKRPPKDHAAAGAGTYPRP